MQLFLDNISKRFDSGWVIRDFNLEVRAGEKLAITGPNGSGKSTLIQIMAGYLSASRGQVKYIHSSTALNRDDLYKHLAIATAYTELDEEMSPTELFRHYKVFKPYLVKDAKAFLEITDLTAHRNKAVKNFSSGMKQRLALGLAICMDVPLLIMDEPGSFLDAERKKWYQNLIGRYGEGKTIVVASNDPEDHIVCTRNIALNLN